jgi:hypothetical protein
MTMYPDLPDLVLTLDEYSSESGFVDRVIPYLVDRWLDHYSETSGPTHIVETTDGGFSYLFDVSLQRLVSAWGISRGRHQGARDASRSSGHPLTAGKKYHRGHAIPHTLGGPMDINLVAQLGKVNVGPFRPLEKMAVATPGSLYFTYWIYTPAHAEPSRPRQTPTGVDQGLLIAGQMPVIVRHGN